MDNGYILYTEFYKQIHVTYCMKRADTFVTFFERGVERYFCDISDVSEMFFFLFDVFPAYLSRVSSEYKSVLSYAVCVRATGAAYPSSSYIY